MSSPDTVIAALRAEHDLLTEFTSTLTEDDLAHSSGSAQWDVSEVLSHLGSGAEITLAGLQSALDGKPYPGREYAQPVWDRWNAMTRRQRADGFVDASRALTEFYESLDADTRESLRVDVGFLPAPIDLATAGRLRLNELALHSWDVRVGFDDNATLTSTAAHQLLHGAPDLLAWAAKPDRLDGERAVIRVTTSDPESAFALRLDERVSVDFDVPEEVDGTLTLPAESWLRLVAGRLAAAHTPDGVTTTDAADVDLLRRVFAGY